MRVFRPEVQRALRAMAIVALIGAVVVPVGWGYEQRQQARRWHQAACTSRLREVARSTSLRVDVAHRGDPCTALSKLGIDLVDK